MGTTPFGWLLLVFPYAENGLHVLVSGGGAGARVLLHSEREGPERDLAGVQVVVRDRAVLQEEGFCG